MDNQEMIVVTCQHCDGRMVEAMIDHTSVIKKLVGGLAFFVGLGLLIWFPVGTMAGIVLVVMSTLVEFRAKKAWKCPQCGYFFQQAD